MINRGYFMNKGALCTWIQEFLQIEIHHPAVSFGNVLLRLVHRLPRAAPRSKTVAVFGERSQRFCRTCNTAC